MLRQISSAFSLSRDEKIALVIATVLIILHLLLSVIGIYRFTWANPQCVNRYRVIIAIVTWMLVYGLSMFGYFYVFIHSSQGRPRMEKRVLLLYLILLTMLIFWDIALYYMKSPLLALGINTIILILALYLFYETWIVSPIAAVLQIPILLRSLYLFYDDCCFTHCHHNNS